MEFRILGPLYAHAGHGSGPAVISQPLLQSALAVLLLRANRPCPRAMLIEALWPAEAPGSAEAALRVCISRLRDSMGACAERLVTVGPAGGSSPGHRQQRGYMMVVRPGELDVDEFTDLAEQGQAELDSGQPAAAASYLVQALALWGDPPLPDLPGSETIRPAVERLLNQRQAAVDTLIDARLAAGEHDRVLSQLRAAVLANPGRERTCAQLMQACQALGLRKEALDVYQLARQAALEQQGASPGPVLTMLYRRILADEIGSAGTAGRRRGSGSGSGSDSGSGRGDARRTGARLTGPQVPAPPSDFTGRSYELSEIAAGLRGRGAPVVVLAGGPGAGKSALACAAALAAQEQFTDGQIYCELGGIASPRAPVDALSDVLQCLGVPAARVPASLAASAALFRSLIANRKVLIVADDVASAGQIRPLLPSAGGAAALITSRGRLAGLAGARIIEVGALAVDDALEVLRSVAGAERVEAEPAAAADVVRDCGGLALAVRLAGTLLAGQPGLPVSALAGQLRDGQALELLEADDVSVRAAIATSYEALTPAGRDALRRVVMRGQLAIDAATLHNYVHGNPRVIDQLIAVGLLSPKGSIPGSASYTIQNLVARYVADAQARPRLSAAD